MLYQPIFVDVRLLLEHFSQRNMESLVKVVRATLEALRKRIISPSVQRYIGENNTALVALQ